MAVELEDFQFEIGGVVFGIGADVTVEDGGFDPGTTEWRTQDADHPTESARHFGRDRQTPKSWSWQMSADQEDVESALAAVEALESAWTDPRFHQNPNTVAPLRYRIAGRTRIAYGRPRRFAAPPDNMILNGYVPITADFVRADELHYADFEESITVGLVPPTQAGWTWPIEFPLASMQSDGEGRMGQFQVTGKVATWVRVTFNGPGRDYKVTVDGKYFAGTVGDVAYDEKITIDPRPWARTITRKDGAGVPGKITRQTRMTMMKLEPGFHEVVLEGVDASNTGSVTLAWRPAYKSL